MRNEHAKADIGHTAAFTGHRPAHFSFGYNEADPECTRVKAALTACVQQLALEGVARFLTGMAQGADIWGAEAVLRHKQAADACLVAVLPCADQTARWRPDWRARYQGILARCDEVICLQPYYTPDCMMRRNRYLVDNARRVVAVYAGAAGGTRNTLAYAMKCGTDIITIHPQSGEITGLALKSLRDAPICE